MRCLRRILHISWSDHITNKQVLERAGVSTMYTLLKQRRLRWLGHISRMEDGRIPKDILYGELAMGKRPTGRPHMRYKDVCKQDLKILAIDADTWGAVAADRCSWREVVKNGLLQFENRLIQRVEEKRLYTREQSLLVRPPSYFICEHCFRDCHSRVGLYSDQRRCVVPLQRHSSMVPRD